MRFTFAELVEIERLTWTDKWAEHVTHAELIVVTASLSRAPTPATAHVTSFGGGRMGQKLRVRKGTQ